MIPALKKLLQNIKRNVFHTLKIFSIYSVTVAINQHFVFFGFISNNSNKSSTNYFRTMNVLNVILLIIITGKTQSFI